MINERQITEQQLSGNQMKLKEQALIQQEED